MNFTKKIAFLAGVFIISVQTSAQDYIELSQNLLRAMRDGKNAEVYVKQIAEINPAKFKSQIDSDEKKLAFWINTYNGLIQYQLTQNPKLYEDRGDFFSDDLITVAGQKVSFDNLEHGVLRRGTSKLSKGYFKNPFGDDWYKQYQVDKIDWRIHFALNCGAADCPPIRIYDDETIYDQLNASSRQYLKEQVKYDKEEHEIYVPALMNWFSGDFGGSDGVRNILEKNGYLEPGSDYDIEYKDYDWTLKLGTFYKD
ncbi:MAG: DUF547 domain-containing protein [Owenweeksia sp.]